MAYSDVKMSLLPLVPIVCLALCLQVGCMVMLLGSGTYMVSSGTSSGSYSYVLIGLPLFGCGLLSCLAMMYSALRPRAQNPSPNNRTLPPLVQ